tara:strand:+ start:4336 stop:4461 length:126 start_codon:yes stop_codon:yes gene_type:complete
MINEILQWTVLAYIVYHNAKLKDASGITKKNIKLINYVLGI